MAAVAAAAAAAGAAGVTAGDKTGPTKLKPTGRGAINLAASFFAGRSVRRRRVAVKCHGLAGNLEQVCTMSSEKSVLIVPPPPKHLCPVCGKPSYSLGGVHPQCAIQQADEPRMVRLRAAKAAAPKTKKPARQSWQKRCPACGLESHVARKVCQCGHNFVTR